MIYENIVNSEHLSLSASLKEAIKTLRCHTGSNPPGLNSFIKKEFKLINWYTKYWFPCIPEDLKIDGLSFLAGAVLNQESYEVRLACAEKIFRLIPSFSENEQNNAHRVMQQFAKKVPDHRCREPELEKYIEKLIEFIPNIQEKEKCFLEVVSLSKPLNEIGHLCTYIRIKEYKGSKSEKNQQDVHRELVQQMKISPELDLISHLASDLPLGGEVEAHDALRDIVEGIDRERFEEIKGRVSWPDDGIYAKQFEEMKDIMRKKLVSTMPKQQ